MPLYLEPSVSDVGYLPEQTVACSSSPTVSSLSPLLLAVFQEIFKTSVSGTPCFLAFLYLFLKYGSC